jgi:sulfate adenylyltransferase
MLIPPYGGHLVDLHIGSEEVAALKARAEGLPSVHLSERGVCDLELLAVGGFSPLTRFMGRADYDSVVHAMRLADGRLFPIPIALPVSRSLCLRLDSEVVLRSPSHEPLAVMRIEEIYPWDARDFAHYVLGTADDRHPLVSESMQWGDVNLSGRLQVISLPRRPDFRRLRLTPAETRRELARMRQRNVVAFQTRNPLHRAHEELTKRAMTKVDGALLLHPVVGISQQGDVDHYTRVRTYRAMVQRYYPRGSVLLALLPLAMRMAGPREALWHAIIRRNYGASHFIVGRSHASPTTDSLRGPFYREEEAQEFARLYSDEIGVSMLPFDELVYLPQEDRYEERATLKPGARCVRISGTQVREDYLNRGRRLPAWFTRPEVADILAEAYPPSPRRGFVVWLTGLSGAGKSTTAEILVALLLEHGRRVSLLDGDIVRQQLCKGLGFTKEDRDMNVMRIGFVAAEIARHGGVTVCAAVSPYRATRDAVRHMIGSPHFIEVFVDAPVEVCEQRDVKGLYAKARRGELRGLTGLDDPYEPPLRPELRVDSVTRSAEENAHAILDVIVSRGLVARDTAYWENAVETDEACGFVAGQ